jgi:hypothetical protein
MSPSLPYHVFEGGIAVCRESHNSEGDWYPPQVLPYFWKDGTLWVCCNCQELGYDKACPIAAARRYPEYTDFFIMRGVMLFGYLRVDGYVPTYLEDLQGEEAILF